jgi:hypothetical protein
VPLSNDILLREAFSTHPLFSGRVFQREGYESKEKKKDNRLTEVMVNKEGPSVCPGSLLKPHNRVKPCGKTTDIGGRVLNRIAR